MNRGVSLEHIEAVIAIEDRVLRNLWVTQTYADLATGLRTLLDPRTSNWHTFATWASSTVGASMRGEALPQWLHERVLSPDGLMGVEGQKPGDHKSSVVRRVLDELQPEHVVEVLRELLGEMAINLSDGNTEVFTEIAPPAAQFIEHFGDASVDPAAARARVMAACDGATAFEGTNRLRAGYSLWCDAMATDDQARRSQLILAGSIQLGVHEQNHLQPVIVSSMDLGVNQAVARLKDRLAKDARVVAAVEHDVDDALHLISGGIGDAWDDLMTATLATLSSPEGTLRLDRDVPALPGRPFQPPELTPIVVPDLGSLLERFNRSDGSGKRSAARDWANFDDRMDFIANLFISRHHLEMLYNPPFDDDTLHAITADCLPASMTRGAS